MLLRNLSTLLMVSLTFALSAADWETSPHGETAYFKMEHTSFPHESRADGHEYKGTKFPADPHYIDNTVALFIPNGYKPGEEIHLLYYWHGWGNSVRNALDQFELRRQVAESGKNVILVFPEGPKDASDSRWGRLEEEGELALLTEEVMAALKAEGKIGAESKLGRVLLSGHSGAYRVLSFSAKLGGLEEHIEDIYLLDATYALLEPFAEILKRNERVRLRSIFTEHLRKDNEDLMQMLRDRGVLFDVLTEEEMPEGALEQQRVIFVPTTDRDHNEAVFVLQDWLAASRLPEAPNKAVPAEKSPDEKPNESTE